MVSGYVACINPLHQYSLCPIFFPRAQKVQPGRTIFKVMSYNVWRNNRHMNEVAAVIRKEQPDILLLQELTPKMVSPLIDALGDFYHNSSPNFNYEKSLLQVVLSRYPISSLGASPKEGQAQKVLIETPETAITVINVHPRRQLSWLKRYYQIFVLLAADFATTNGPLILGGDFHTTEESQRGRLIKRYLSDAHTKTGKGFGFTFPASADIFGGKVHIPPLVRIDHIFYNNYFVPKSARTLRESGGSDHFPVVAELSLDLP
jgi:vancomycin resistance protein VanJ